jgi:hypothetical protein
MNFVKTTIRCECDLDDIENGFKTIAGKTIAAWSGAGAQFQFLLKRGTNLLDVSNLSSVTLTILAADRTGSAFLTKTISGASIDNTVDATSWADGSKQHLKFDLTGAEMALPVTTGQLSTIYFLVLSGYTTDAPTDPDTFAWAQIAIHRDGVPTASTYVQAGNLVSGGATYDGSGHYVLSVTTGKYYKWVDGGANDTSVTNGAQTVTVDGTNFLTQGATITLNGTAGQPVTATIYPSPIITADEIAALVASLITGTGGVVVGESTVGNGVEQVVVDISALGLSSTPTSILAEVVKPGVGAMIWCSIVAGSATATQFTVQLSAMTELATYKIRYHVKP